MAYIAQSKVKYSKKEKELFGLLKKGKPISSMELVKLHYVGKRKAPRNARQSVNSIMKSLIRKTNDNKEEYNIIKSERNGPHPTKYTKVNR